MTAIPNEPRPLAVSINEASRMLGIGRTKLHELIAAGKLPARKLGSRTVVLASGIESFLASLPAAGKPGTAAAGGGDWS